MNDSIKIHVADSIRQARLELLRDTTGKTDVEKGIMQAIEDVSTMSTEELLYSLLDGVLSFGFKLLAALAIYFVGAWLIRRIKRMLAALFVKRNADPAIASFVQGFCHGGADHHIGDRGHWYFGYRNHFFGGFAGCRWYGYRYGAQRNGAKFCRWGDASCLQAFQSG